MIEQEGRFTYFKGFPSILVEFKTFQQGEYDFQPLLWETYPKRNNWKPNIASPKSAWNDVLFVSPGDSYWSWGTRQIWLGGGPHHWTQAQGILSILGSTTRWRGFRRYRCIGGSSWNAGRFFFFSLGWWKWLATYTLEKIHVEPPKMEVWKMRTVPFESFCIEEIGTVSGVYDDASSWNGWKWLEIWKVATVATIESWIVLYCVHWDCHFGGTLCFLRFSPQLLDSMFWAVDK